jgi:2-phospho-L-lactate guanylyltransferase
LIVPVTALIPIRSFASGKGRLARVLSEGQRVQLAAALAERTIEAVESAGVIPAVITSDPDVTVWAMVAGLVVIPESGPGLNQAATDGVDWARSMSLQWIVLHSDVPLIKSDDLTTLATLAGESCAVISPSSDGGTTAVSSPNSLDFSYGPGSFHRHLGRLNEPAVVIRTGLLHDLDSPEDLNSARTHPDGVWLEAVVGGVVR